MKGEGFIVSDQGEDMNPKGNPLEFLNQILVNYLVLWSDYVRPRVRYTKKFEIPWKLFLLNI